MKRNLILFGIFVALLGITYVFQEKRIEKEHAASHERDQLIRGEILQLKLPALEARKENGQWWAGKTLLSHNTFKQIEKKLGEIMKVKDIEGSWENFFTNPLKFQVNGVDWAIGSLSLDKQAFYISENKKVYLAVIEGESAQLTKNSDEIEGIKLEELASLLTKPEDQLRENQLFRFYPNLPMEKVVLSVEGNLPYELDLENNATLPPPLKGVSVHKNLRGKFKSLLTQMTLKEEVPYSEKLKFKLLGELTFSKGTESQKWELWLKSDKSADAYIIDSAHKRAFLMVGGTLKLFFVTLQDYWDKKVIPPGEFVAFTRLETTFVQGEKSARVAIINKEPFEFESPKHKVDKLKFEQLIQIIFNLGPRDQADRVSNLSASERKQLLSETHLRVEVMGQDLVLWRKTEELIVANLTQGFKAHFSLLDENFRGTFEDVLK